MQRGNSGFDAVIREAISPVVARIAAKIARDVSAMVAREVEAAVKPRGTGSRARPLALPRRRARVEIVRWVADRRARRVPNFVIQATGLATKKKIVAKFGENAAFAKGKPLPAAIRRSASEPRMDAKAKPPVARGDERAAA